MTKRMLTSGGNRRRVRTAGSRVAATVEVEVSVATVVRPCCVSRAIARRAP